MTLGSHPLHHLQRGLAHIGISPEDDLAGLLQFGIVVKRKIFVAQLLHFCRFNIETHQHHLRSDFLDALYNPSNPEFLWGHKPPWNNPPTISHQLFITTLDKTMIRPILFIPSTVQKLVPQPRKALRWGFRWSIAGHILSEAGNHRDRLGNFLHGSRGR